MQGCQALSSVCDCVCTCVSLKYEFAKQMIPGFNPQNSEDSKL